MPEALGALLAQLGGTAAADAALGAGTEVAAGAGADAALGAGFGGAADLAAAGLPFAAGAGEIGSVAAGAGAASLPMGVELAGAGLPFAAGAGETGAGTLDLGSLLAGAGDTTTPPNASLTSGGPVSFGGVSSVGGIPDNVGTPSFASAPAVTGGPAPTGVTGLPGVSGAAGAAAAAPPAGAGPLDLTSLLGKAGSSIASNPLGLALAAGGLGYSMLKGSGESATTSRIAGQDTAVKAAAGDIMNTGKGLASHVESGTLPLALQQQLDSQIKDAKTKMISTYATNGMNTDPNKNSMLRQELDSIDKRGLSLKGEMEKQLLASGATLINSGTALVGADNQLITTLSGIDQQQQKNISSAIANFAAALSGKSGSGLTLSLGDKKAA